MMATAPTLSDLVRDYFDATTEWERLGAQSRLFQNLDPPGEPRRRPGDQVVQEPQGGPPARVTFFMGDDGGLYLGPVPAGVEVVSRHVYRRDPDG